MDVYKLDALHCLMSYVALVLHHDIALQKKSFRKSGLEALIRNNPKVPR